MINTIFIQVPLRDGGQSYTETNLHHIIVEPWNFVTALFFIVAAVYWIYKIRFRIKEFGFLFSMLILLLVGGIGGTIYHGFRLYRIFLMMDWMPIILITFSVSVYFFIKAWGKWWPPVLLFVIYFFVQGILFRSSIPIQTTINISYASMAIIVLFPLVWYLKKTEFRNYQFILAAIIFFTFALFFRWADKFDWLMMGTHFLWHIFGLIAANFIISFLYTLDHKKKI